MALGGDSERGDAAGATATATVTANVTTMAEGGEVTHRSWTGAAGAAGLWEVTGV
ncbi:hypothetical protein ACFZAE_21270 [Streptomyces scabiei]|uniref:hypothetical protein n=1 Tax=Streptomyces TaxID=1883 RepID=UPI001BFFBDB6|nr:MULTISPECIES: hypothetical protein [unclassified Streptomyces]